MLIRTNATDEAKHTVRQKVTSLLLTNRPTNNMSPAEIEATKELKMDKDIIVLPADKGRPTVVMNRVDYNEKAQALLDDQQSYKSTSSSRAKSMIGQLTGLLNRLKRNSAISLDEWRQMKPTDTALARFYGLPKIQKPNVPLRPIVALKAVLLTIYPSGWPENLTFSEEARGPPSIRPPNSWPTSEEKWSDQIRLWCPSTLSHSSRPSHQTWRATRYANASKRNTTKQQGP
ncbi:hypothetical protein SprV_0200743500 [Sparganum proliferum]